MLFLTRRIFLTSFVLATIAPLFHKTLVWSQETQSVEIKWRVPREQVTNVTQGLEFDRNQIRPDLSTAEDTKGLPLVYIFVGTVVIGKLAKTLLDIYRDTKYGGIIAHCQDEEIVIENDIRLSSGTMIIVCQDDVKVFQDKNQPGIADIVEALKVLLKK